MLDMQPQLARPNGPNGAHPIPARRRKRAKATRRSCSGAGRLAVERRRGDRAAALARPDRDRPDRAAGARPAPLRQLPRPFRRRQRVRCGDPLARSAAQLVRLRRPPGQRARHLQAYRRRAGEAAAARRARLQGGAASGIAAGRTVPAAHRRSGAAAALARGPGDGGCRACGACTVPGGRWLAGRRFARPHRRAAAIGRGCRSAGAAATSGVAPPGTVARRCAAAGGTHRGSRAVRGRGRGRHADHRPAAPSAAALSARGHAAPRLRRARAAGRRHGPRQDRSRRSPPRELLRRLHGRRARAGGLPGVAEGRVAGADRALQRRGHAAGHRQPAGTARAVRAARLLHRGELRAGRHRRRRHQPTRCGPTSSSSTRRSGSRTGTPRRRAR